MGKYLNRFLKKIKKDIRRNAKLDVEPLIPESYFTDTPSDTSSSLVKDKYKTKRKEA